MPKNFAQSQDANLGLWHCNTVISLLGYWDECKNIVFALLKRSVVDGLKLFKSQNSQTYGWHYVAIFPQKQVKTVLSVTSAACVMTACQAPRYTCCPLARANDTEKK